MKVILLMALMLLGGVIVGCGQVEFLQESGGAGKMATPMPPATPESPKAPKAAQERPSTPRPADTPVPAHTPASENAGGINGEYAVLLTDPVDKYFDECVEIAESRIDSQIIVDELRRAQPKSLADRERFRWRQELDRLDRHSNASLFFSCAALWSEPIDEENASKRNWSFANECVNELGLRKPSKVGGSSDDPSFYRGMVVFEYEFHSGGWEMMAVPYYELSVGDKFALRSMVEPDYSTITDRIRYLSDGGCSAYYPQLFFGRWIPAYKDSNTESGEDEWIVETGGFLGIYNGEAVLCEEPNSGNVVSGTDGEWHYVAAKEDDDGYCVNRLR